jgi:hypothetical protein
MSPKELAQKMRSQIESLARENKPLALAASTVTAQMASRIFVDGNAKDSGKIGSYNNTDYLYLNPTDVNVVGRSRIGSPGSFENGNPRKTVKLTYQQYKARLGKPAGGAYVNLELSGDMKSDFTNNPKKVNVNEYQVLWHRDINSDKAAGNESHFGKKIFGLTPAEQDKFFKTAEFELKKHFST